ncbi:MAG: PDZ domain-containing protein [Candidatus Aminicenantes bacterium]|nr:PDZ domain-containing protein [Candidatus Aminicenantes bacterium]
MKKKLFLLLLFLLTVYSVTATEKINAIENEIKIVLNQVSPSLVKVVSENAKRYVATGIALEDELIITTALITSRPYEKLYVEDIHGVKMTAVMVGQDNRSGLALLRLNQKGPRQLLQSRQAAVGDWVALIGLFYNRFPAISQGIVSSRSEAELIVNAPVAPGSAGGAVVNKKGELLGVIRGSVGFSYAPEYTFKDHSTMIVVSGSKNESGSLCYALPIEKVSRIAQILKTTGKIAYGWLGVSFSGDSNYIQAVEKNSPAQKAGIAKGDRIEKISGKPIARFRDITAALQFAMAGDKVRITVTRAGKPLRLEAVLTERPTPAPPLARELFPETPDMPPVPLTQWAERLSEIPELSGMEMNLPMVKNYVIEFSGARQLGIDIMEMTDALSQKFLVKEGYGLLVSRVNESSAAQKAGLHAGDILVRANGHECRTAFDLRNVIKVLRDKEALQLELYRDGQLRKFSIIPDKKESFNWDMKKFSEKMQTLQKNIRSEAKIVNDDQLNQLRQARSKAENEYQRQKEQALLQLQLQSKKMAEALRRLEAKKNKLSSELKAKYSEPLRRLQDEIKKIEENIHAELEAGHGANKRDASSQQ